VSLILAKILLDIGYGSGTTVSDVASDMAGGSAVGAIEDFNGFLLNMLIYAGAIIVAIAIIKMIIAMQQQDSHSKMQATLLFGLGAVFVSSNAIITAIDIKNNSGNPTQIVLNIAGVAGTVLKLVAIILLAVAILQMILSFINEDGAQKADAGKLMSVGGALYSLKAILITAADYAMQPAGMANVTKLIIDVIADVSRFIGIILGVYGLFHTILSLKDQDSSQLQRHIVLLTIGIILAAMPLIFSVFGLR
jgi:hypothetical protein